MGMDGSTCHAEFDADGQLLAGSAGFLEEGRPAIAVYLAGFSELNGAPATVEHCAEIAFQWRRGTVIEGRLPSGDTRILMAHPNASGGVTLLSIGGGASQKDRSLTGAISDASPMPVFANEIRSGAIRYANERACALFELEAGRPHNIVDILPDHNQNRWLLRELRRHGAVDNVVARAQTATGRTIWLVAAAGLIRHDGRSLVQFVIKEVHAAEQHKAEVTRSLDLLRDAIRPLSEGFALYGENERLIFCNDRFSEMHAAVPDLLDPGSGWSDLVHQLARRSVLDDVDGGTDAAAEEMLAAARAYKTFEIEDGDGTSYSVSVRPTPLGGFVVTQIDISAQRVAEQSDRLSQELLSKILEASPANLSMSRIGDGEIVYSSPGFIALFGTAGTASDHFADPLDRADFMAALLQNGRVDHFRTDAAGASGSVFPALFSARVIEHRGEEVMVCAVTDLTERVSAERTIEEASIRLRDAIEALSEGFILYDADERVVMANRRFLEMNAPYANLIVPGTHTRDLLCAAVDTQQFVDAERWLADYDAERERGEQGSQRAFEFQLADGSWVNSVRRPTREGGFVITWLDVTERKRASEELARANDRLRDAIDSIDEAFGIFDADARLIAWNRRYEELSMLPAGHLRVGITQEEILEAALESGGFENESADRIRQLIEKGDWRSPMRTEFAQKSGKWYLVSRRPTIEGGFVVTRLDITDQKRAAEELTRLNDRMRDAIESLDEGFALYDADDRLVMWNDRYERLNSEISEVIRAGVTYGEILETAIQTHDLPPEEVARVRESGSRENGNYRRRFEFQDQEGRWFAVSRHPTSEDGFVITRADITDRMQAEQADREAYMLPQRVLDACPVALVMSEPDTGERIFSNMEDHELLGGNRAEGSSWADLSERAEFMRRFSETGRVDEMQVTMLRGDDTPFPALMSARSIEFRGKSYRATYTVDLSERIAMEQELARQKEMLHQSEKLSALGELLAGVAHELNNPLSVVVGHALMLEEEIEDAHLLKRTRKISSAAERCSRIVKAFLAMARQRPSKSERMQINTVIDTALDVAGYRLRSAGVRIERQFAPDLPPVTGDLDQLAQVFANLIVNAEHVLVGKGSEGCLTLATRLSKKGDEVVIEISDNGPGIPEPIRARIFEPFFTTKTVGEGTGIGLAFCHRIIATHGGRISVDEAPEGGARFTIALSATRSAMTQSVSADGVLVANGRVLVVDDERDVAELIAQILIADGYEVVRAGSAEEGLSQLPGKFDLILSDLNMPGLGGRAFIAEIKDRWPGLEKRIGFITGDTMSPDAEQFLQLANRPYLEKPVTPSDVRQLAARMMGEVRANA